MDLIPGFAWPVPRAFSSAVAACRFEQGDVLYDHPLAYGIAADGEPGSASSETREVPGDWGSLISILGHSVQVLDPPRSARHAPSDSAARRFLVNWEAPVHFELCDYRNGRSEMLKSTQGRLFSCLWKGDPSLLSADGPGSPSPQPPVLARELQKALEQALPAVRRAASSAASLDGALVFVFVVDESSDASLAKQRAILAALRGGHRTHAIDLAPGDAGLADAPGFHPALRVRGYLIEAASEPTVKGLLKAVLYSPTRPVGAEAADGTTETATEPDRFRLERHGLLVEARPAS